MFWHFVPFSTTVTLFDSLGYANVSALLTFSTVLGLATEQVITTEKRVSDMLFLEIAVETD